MNTELKFRLIDKNGKVVGFEKWHVGESDQESGWIYSKDGQCWDRQQIPHSLKDQFSGLLDKNNSPIFTRDAVRFRHRQETITGVVKHRDMVIEYVAREREDEYGYYVDLENISICTLQHHLTLEKMNNIDENQIDENQ